MEKQAKLLMGVLAVLAIVFVLTQGEITGKATASCSELPTITSIKALGNTVSLHGQIHLYLRDMLNMKQQFLNKKKTEVIILMKQLMQILQ